MTTPSPTTIAREVLEMDAIATKEPWSLPIRDANVSKEQHEINIRLTEHYRTSAPLLARRVLELERENAELKADLQTLRNTLRDLHE